MTLQNITLSKELENYLPKVNFFRVANGDIQMTISWMECHANVGVIEWEDLPKLRLQACEGIFQVCEYMLEHKDKIIDSYLEETKGIRVTK